MSKYDKIAEMLKRRILNEDYAMNRLPGARKLAKETGVSYMTARQAIQKLFTDEVITQQDNGRFVVNRRNPPSKKEFKIAFLIHQSQSAYNVWEQAVRQAARKNYVSFRCVYFSHDDDPVITEVISGDFDLVFLSHSTMMTTHPFILDLVRRNKDKVVTLFHDLTSDGIRCLDGPEPSAAGKLVDKLYELGHRKFATYQLSSLNNSSCEKVANWEKHVAKYKLKSKRFEFQKDYSYEYLLVPAYRGASRIFAGKKIPSAVFCHSLELAIGLIRYCYDNGVKVGKDISICSFGQPEMARTFIPSITIIDRPNPLPQAEAILEDFISGDNSRLLYRPEDGDLIIGESTGPAPA